MPKNTPERIIDARTTPSGVVVAYANGGGGGGAGGVPLSRQIIAGAGLAGGGPLIADITLNVGAGEGLVANADNLALSPFVAGDALGYAAGVLNVIPGEGMEIEGDAIGLKSSVAGAGLGYSAGVLSVGLGEGLEFEGDAIGLKANVAGAGLGYSAGVLSVGVAGLGLSVEADLVRLTSSSNPTAAAILATNDSGGVTLLQLTIPTLGVLYVDGVVDFGSDTLYEDATYLQVAGAKEVNFGQTIRGGSNWSMTLAGALAAQSGNFAGDLYGAGSAFRVINHTHDAPHSHVVINPGPLWSLDEQFGLDIDDNLLVRGWIVGKHATQLPGATMILHFDGPQPYESNFVGQLTGHLGQVGTPFGNVAFRPGKFGKGLMLGPAATNLLLNPSFENNVTSGWNTAITGTGGDRTRDATRSYVGGASARVTASSGGVYTIRSNQAAVPAGASVTVQCRMLRGSNINAQLQIRDNTNNSTRVTAAPTQINVWELLTCTWTNTTGATANVELRVSNTHGDGSGSIWVDACQMELSSYMTPYFDGSMYNPATWTGTAHASSSTRAAGHVTYLPAGVVRAAAGTMMGWVNVAAITGSRQYLIDPGGAGADGMYLAVEADGKPRFYYSSAAGAGVSLTGATAIAPRTWVHLAATWGPDGAVLHVNGVAAATSTTAAGGTTLNAALAIGRSYASASGWWNGWQDDLVFADRACSADEVRAIAESNAPVFAETSTWQWRAGRNRFWADAEGIWMLNAAGQPMFGAYAGDEADSGATKTWGGLPLSASDVLIGDANRGGYVQWDDSAATMKIKGIVEVVAGGNAATTTELVTGLAGKIDVGEAADDINFGSTLISGAKIVTGSIDADRIKAASNLAIGASTAWQSNGVQIQYNGGSPRAYIGNAAQTRFFRYEGGNVTWKAAKTELSADGSLTASDVVLNSATIGNVKTDSGGIYIPAPAAADLAKGYKFTEGENVIGGLTMFYLANSNVSLGLWSNVNSALDGAALGNILKPDTDAYWDGGAAARGVSANAAASQTNLTAKFISSTNVVKTATIRASANNSETRIDLIADNLYGATGQRIWNDAKAGHYADGSGYNADMLDGYHAGSFAAAVHSHAAYAALAGADFSGPVALQTTLGMWKNETGTEMYRYFDIGLWKASTGQPANPPVGYIRLFVRRKNEVDSTVELMALFDSGSARTIVSQ